MKVAVIPARGGSKRIPRKNIRLFAGKPMIAYSIECAIRTQLFDQIVVSTDDAEISDIARHYGAEVPFVRPAELSDDLTFPAPVIAHAVRWLQNHGNALAAVCTIYPTAPFIREEDVTRALEVLESGDWQYVFPATTFAYPVFRSFHQDEAGGLQMFFLKNSMCARKICPKRYTTQGSSTGGVHARGSTSSGYSTTIRQS